MTTHTVEHVFDSNCLHASKCVYIFLGLRPLAGYASLKLYHVMSCFVHEKRILCYDMAMLPTLTPDNAGDAGFLGPSRAPTQKADMGSRARARQRTQKKQPKKSSPQASPETQTQQNTVNSSVLWLSARAPKSPKTQREKSKDCAAREPATARAKRTEQQPNAQRSSLLRYLQRFGERGPSITGMPGSAWRQNAQK